MFKNKALLTGIAVILLIPVLVVAYWLLSPLFIDEEVNEEFPFARVAVIPDGMTKSEAEATMVAASEQTQNVSETMPELTAVELNRGNFTEIDAVHKGKGEAILYQISDGTGLLRFENFEVTNGPDLHVFLTTVADPRSEDWHNGQELDLGSLKGNIGSQNYEIPAEVDLSQYKSVIIYCVPFRVTFSTASLQ
jgi:hypothetical protein